MSTNLSFRTRNKTIFWSTLVTPKSINNEFNQPGHSIHFLHGQKFIPSTTKKTLHYEVMNGQQRTTPSDSKGKMRHVVTKILRKHTCGLNESKDPYLRSIIHIHSHIPIYVNKANYFYPPYFGQPWTHLFDRLYLHVNTHTGEQPYFHLTGHNCISTKAARTLCFSLVFIPVLLWILNCLFLNVRSCHIPFILRACKICVVFVVELNLKVIPVKYGRELTNYKLESNISTKQLHAPTITLPPVAAFAEYICLTNRTDINARNSLKWLL